MMTVSSQSALYGAEAGVKMCTVGSRKFETAEARRKHICDALFIATVFIAGILQQLVPRVVSAVNTNVQTIRWISMC